mgnify:CR=1 FL=1
MDRQPLPSGPVERRITAAPERAQHVVPDRRGEAFARETADSGSLTSPKTIACDGQASWQAVTISPSTICRPSPLAAMRAWLMRWTQ